MRRHLLIVALALVIGSGVAVAAVSGTAHDLSTHTTSGETCIFCHTPHNSAPDVPLWNHSLSGGSFTVYTSTTMNATSGDFAGGDNNISALCMSCHDGVTGLGAVGNPSAAGTITDPGAMTGANALGIDLTNDHPVNISYEVGADGELDTVANAQTDGIVFFAGTTVQCASCHDVHNFGATADLQPFLAVSQTNSGLCNACHLK